MIQIADLVLYPMAKGGYDSDYRPYKKLKESGKLIDCLLTGTRFHYGASNIAVSTAEKIKGSGYPEPSKLFGLLA